MRIHFYKYQGAGNDFVMLENAAGLSKSLIKRLCDRCFGIGGDGLISIEKDDAYDFSMRYYNCDGRESTMCGNGGRCAAAFALLRGLTQKPHTTFIAVDGVHEAYYMESGNIRLRMTDVKKINHNGAYSLLNTGSPHYVSFCEDLSGIDVFSEGRKIRNSFKNGVNVNFVKIISGRQIALRTYERGVENETLACGTGATASALAAKSLGLINGNSIKVKTLGGALLVESEQISVSEFKNIWLSGPACLVFEGEFEL